MSNSKSALCILAAFAIGFVSSGAKADVFNMPAGQTSLQMVTVGNPNNPSDPRYPNFGVSSFGAVGYTYQMGKYDVTAGQYCEFLNAVDKTEAYALYTPDMNVTQQALGCNIVRTGSQGNFSYSVAPEWANRPVNLVSWGSAVRFCNWLSNGQPKGLQNASTTEDGSYATFNATSDFALMGVVRKPNARYVIPTDDEWYKAAYYDPAKPGGAGYWDYPTRSNQLPSNVLDSAGTNNANFNNNGAYTIGAPYWRTEVGAFAASPGPYGTFDQGGNIWQWTERVMSATNRGTRGGSLFGGSQYLLPSGIDYGPPNSNGNFGFGFRVALVPEPATLTLFGLTALVLSRRPSRRRAH